MTDQPIPILKVYMPSGAGKAVQDVLYSGLITTGPRTDEFEEKFGKVIGNPNVVATNSGTAAIVMALYMAGLRPGEEVICMPLTCVAVVEPVFQTGATIVWADVDPLNGNISAESIEQKVTPKTRAIVYSHCLGRLADTGAINRVAKKHGLLTIEDAASAFGGEYDGRMIGVHSDYTAFSFQAVKQITTGDGGMLSVKTSPERERAILLRNHGNDRHSKRTALTLNFDVTEAGWKCQMNDIAATIGLEQLKDFAGNREIHRRNNDLYMKRLKGVAGLEVIEEYPKARSNPWTFTVLVENREGFVRKLQEKKIGCSIIHMRVDAMTLFRPYRSDLPALDGFYGRMMNIPVGWWMSEEMIHSVCDVIVAGW